MYEVNSNKAYINGRNGIYDGKINNPSVRYGRNAVDNYKGYVSDFQFNAVKLPNTKGLASLTEDKFESRMAQLEDAINKIDEQKMPPVNFVHTYSELKDGLIDTISLMAASYEELGGTSIKTAALSKKLKDMFTPSIFKQLTLKFKAFLKGIKTPKIKYHPNKMSAKAYDLNDDGKIDTAEYAASIIVSDNLSNGKTDGTITNQGMNKSLAYAIESNFDVAREELSEIYESYNLKAAQEEFLSDPNNLIK